MTCMRVYRISGGNRLRRYRGHTSSADINGLLYYNENKIIFYDFKCYVIFLPIGQSKCYILEQGSLNSSQAASWETFAVTAAANAADA